MSAALVDAWGRTIDYLRISVTDKCNLRCRYCMPEDGVDTRSHQEVLTIEEMYRMTALFVASGIRKIRITGGEPLVRKGILDFIRQVRQLPIEDLSMTTNGTRLAEQAAALKEAGLDRVNIGLDTIDPEVFAYLTRGGSLKEALEGLEAALLVGFRPVKINAVVMRGCSDAATLWQLALLAKDRPVHVRFIEFMPLGGGLWSKERFVPAAEMKTWLETAAKRPLAPARVKGNGPAEVFAFPDWQGSIGFIHAVSDHFCGACNRLRFTSEGRIYPCLHSNASQNVFPLLRQNADDATLLAAIQAAVATKPQRSVLGSQGKEMNTIGG